MDTAITRIGGVVLDELRSAGYMGSTIGPYEKTIRALTGYARRHGTGIYTPTLGAGFASLTTSPRTGRFSAQRRSGYRRLVAVFDSYVATGRVDLSVRKRGGGGSQPTGNQFVALDAAREAEMADRGLAPATREAYGRVSRGYLSFLESRALIDVSLLCRRRAQLAADGRAVRLADPDTPLLPTRERGAAELRGLLGCRAHAVEDQVEVAVAEAAVDLGAEPAGQRPRQADDQQISNIQRIAGLLGMVLLAVTPAARGILCAGPTHPVSPERRKSALGRPARHR